PGGRPRAGPLFARQPRRRPGGLRAGGRRGGVRRLRPGRPPVGPGDELGAATAGGAPRPRARRGVAGARPGAGRRRRRGRGRLWDVETGEEGARLEGHTGWLWALAVSPDGRRALSGSADTTLRLWDLASGEEAMRFTAHGKTVHAVAFAPDGRRAASGGSDQ